MGDPLERIAKSLHDTNNEDHQRCLGTCKLQSLLDGDHQVSDHPKLRICYFGNTVSSANDMRKVGYVAVKMLLMAYITVWYK